MREKASCPMVSVCIANYNGMDIIDSCIESVLAQDFAGSVEIIVHDDASTDGSARHIRTRYPTVLLIESGNNVGFCVANNRMLAQARGSYILLLNNDAELMPDALQTLLTAAQAAVKPAILSLPQYNAQNGKTIDRGCLLDPFFNPVPNLDPLRRQVAMVIGACLWIPKNLWDELGGFPEWFGSIGEDLYLCCRARLAGYSVHVPPASGYRHRVGTSFGGGKEQDGRLVTTFKRRALSERNKTFVMILCCPFPLLVLLPLHLVLLHLEGAILTLLKRDANLWQAIYAPLLPALWKARGNLVSLRREIQRRRVCSFHTFTAQFRWMPWKLRMWIKHGLPQVE